MQKKKILIHDNNTVYSQKWIEYCRIKGYDYQTVDCFANNIIAKLKDAHVLLWRWKHYCHADVMVAKDIIAAAVSMGVVVFPDLNTCRTYDNKIAQKYQLEAIDAPLVPTYIFYDKNSAMKWVQEINFPKVFKLSKGARARNVRLVKTKREAKVLINKAFAKGFKPARGQFTDSINKMKNKQTKKQR